MSLVSPYNKFFTEYELLWEPAIRTANRGRASGGMLCGIKKHCLKVKIKFEQINTCNIIRAELSEGPIFLMPVYLNYNKWDSDFVKFKNTIGMCEKNVSIIGDLNVQIGEEQSLSEEILNLNGGLRKHRTSDDNRVNTKGRRLLEFVKDMGAVILNGRMEGDYTGKYTFIGAMGSSVNDLAIINGDLAMYVKELKVHDSIFSDHMPLELVLEDRGDDREQSVNLLPKLRWDPTKVDTYKKQINQKMREIESRQENVNITAERIADIIKEVGKTKNREIHPNFKQKWFTHKCYKARSKSFAWLNIFRKTNSETAKNYYLSANRYFKDICKTERAAYYNAIGEKLRHIKDSKEWWNWAMELKNKTYSRRGAVDCKDLKNYFSSAFNVTNHNNLNNLLTRNLGNTVEELDAAISFEEVQTVLKDMKNNKAAGEDGIPVEFYKYAPPSLLNYLVKALNNILDANEVEDVFVKSVIFPIYKKGNVNDVTNYRPISFVNSICKIFSGVLNKRLVRWTEDYQVLNEFQAGFRQGYSTQDNIFNYVNAIKLKWKLGTKKIYSFFIDFKAAFDGINRSKLFHKLRIQGVSEKLCQAIEKLYRGTYSAVWDGEAISKWFSTTTGLKQGCILSPLLFALFINDLEEEIGGGINIDEVNIKLLAYADDIVFLSDEVPVLQNMIDNLGTYCKKWDLVINLTKSKIMIMKQTGGRRANHEKWTWMEEEIEIVKKYKYLGFLVTPSLNITVHLQDRIEASKTGLSTVWNTYLKKREVTLKDKLKLFNSISRSMTCYGAQVWGGDGVHCFRKVPEIFFEKNFALATNYSKLYY